MGCCRMFPILLVLTLILGIFAPNAASAQTCNCPWYTKNLPLPEDHVVFWGPIRAVETLDEKSHRAEIEVQRVQKGDVSAVVSVIANRTQSDCGVEFDVGEPVVVTAYRGELGQYQTSLCYGTFWARFPGEDLTVRAKPRATKSQEAVARTLRADALEAATECRPRDPTHLPRVVLHVYDTGDFGRARHMPEEVSRCIGRWLGEHRDPRSLRLDYPVEILLQGTLERGSIRATPNPAKPIPLLRNHIGRHLEGPLLPANPVTQRAAAQYAASTGEPEAEVEKLRCLVDGLGVLADGARGRDGDHVRRAVYRFECAARRGELDQALSMIRSLDDEFVSFDTLAKILVASMARAEAGFPLHVAEIAGEITPSDIIRVTLENNTWPNAPIFLEWIGWALATRSSEAPWYGDLAALAYLRAGYLVPDRYPAYAALARDVLGSEEELARVSATLERIARESDAKRLEAFSARTTGIAETIADHVLERGSTIASAPPPIVAPAPVVDDRGEAKKALGYLSIAAAIVVLGIAVLFAAYVRMRWR